MMKNRFSIILKEQDEWGIWRRAYVWNVIFVWKDEILGCIERPLPHIPDHHTTSPVLQC
jgi:hypothetical protein